MERMDRDMPFLLQYEHVAWFEKGKVRILDRRVYPTEVRVRGVHGTTTRWYRPSRTW